MNTVTIVPVELYTYTTVAVWLALVGIQNILIIINEALMLNISFSNAAGALYSRFGSQTLVNKSVKCENKEKSDE